MLDVYIHTCHVFTYIHHSGDRREAWLQKKGTFGFLPLFLLPLGLLALSPQLSVRCGLSQAPSPALLCILSSPPPWISNAYGFLSLSHRSQRHVKPLTLNDCGVCFLL